jgi:hypothetical protein
LVAACGDNTGPTVPADLSGVWSATGDFLSPVDTLTLLIPEAPDSFAQAFILPRRNSGWFGLIHRNRGHISGTFATPFGFGGGGVTLDLTLRGSQLRGTVSLGSAEQKVFSRYLPSTTRFVGTWVTMSVTGSAGTVFFDTLVIARDGRIRRYTELGIGGNTTCSMSGMGGVYRVESDWLISNYAWPLGNPCTHVRLLDSLKVEGETLTRTTKLITGDLVEVLTRR